MSSATNNVVAAVTTDSNGAFSFSGVRPGTYTVEEVLQAGYDETSSPSVYTLATVSGQTVAGLNFGDVPRWSVSGTLFDDVNRDGSLDDGELGLVGWTIHLVNSSNQVIASETTDSSGDYTFSGTGAGTFTIADVLQPGYAPTLPATSSISIVTSSGAQFTGENFGVYKAVSLAVSGLETVPSTGLQSGASVLIEWADTNTGSSAAVGSFYDQVVITNTTTGQQLGSSLVQYNAAALGDLASGASAPEQYVFTLPNGNAGVGQIEFTVTADALGDVSTSAGESNDVESLTEASTLAPYPELDVTAVTASSSVEPGRRLQLGGRSQTRAPPAPPAHGPSRCSLRLIRRETTRHWWALKLFQARSRRDSQSRSMNVQLPGLAPGNYWFVVTENPFGQLFELSSAGDTAVASQSTNLAGGLTLTLASDTESDAAGSNATTATVTRNTDTTDALLVTIANSDTYDVSAPQTVTIPAGAASVTFPVGTIDNYVVEGTQVATLTASASGLASGSAALSVTDTNVPTLTVALASHTVNETDPNPATYATVTSNDPQEGTVTVSIVSSLMNKLMVPATVTIPAGSTSATVPVTVVNDGQIDGNETTTITASASGFQSGSDSALVIDDNVPTLSLALAQSTVSEAAGADATTATVSIASPASAPLTIVLSSSNTMKATVPASVLIDAGQDSVSFPIAAVNNGLNDGNQTAVITASIETYAGVVLTQGSGQASLLVLNANGPALSLSFANSTVEEGATATATISRNTDTTDPLVVVLTSGDPTEATVPSTVTIPAGQTSVSFTVNAVQAGNTSGTQYVQIFATATGLDTGLATLGIADVELPDLVVSNVTAPTAGYDNMTLSVSWTVANSGNYPATGSWVDQLYLDPAGGPQATSPADSVTFTGTLDAGQSYTQTDTIPSPTTVGAYVVRVVTDPGQSVQELTYSDNSGVSAASYNDQPAYVATVTPSARGRLRRHAGRSIGRRNADERRYASGRRPGECRNPARRHDAHAHGHHRRERKL